MSRHTVTLHLEMTFDQEVSLANVLEDLRQPLHDAATHRLGIDMQPPVIMEVSITDGPLSQLEQYDTWTVYGNWVNDEPVSDLAIRGGHLDSRKDDGTGENQPWCTFAWARNTEEALRKAIAEMRGDSDD